MKYLLLSLFICFLSGCWLTKPSSNLPMGVSPLVLYGAGETVSYLATGKIMEDHVADWITGKNCSLGRKLSGEGPYCMTEFEIMQANRPLYTLQKVYCYQSLAQPTCYAQPSPYPTDVLIGVYERPIYPQQ